MTRRSDLILGWSMLVISLIYIWQTSLLPTGEHFLNSSQSFPMLIGVSITLLSIIVIVKALKTSKEKSTKAVLISKQELKRGLFYIIWTAVYIFILIPFFGFTISTIGYIMFMIIYYREVKWYQSIFIAVGSMLVLYYLFNQILHINFP